MTALPCYQNDYLWYTAGMTAELVYPVYSRRSEGISIGIDLFPDKKHCSFNCPYCEVHPFHHTQTFNLTQLKRELAATLDFFAHNTEHVKDIAFAGHGEPLLSPFFIEAATCAAELKNNYLPDVPLVIITNSKELGRETLLDFLVRLHSETKLHIWAKLDAGSPVLFYRMSGLSPESGVFEIVKAHIVKAGQRIPLVLQTMLTQYQGIPPTREEIITYAELVNNSRARGASFERIDLYTVSRKPLTPVLSALHDEELIHNATIIKTIVSDIELRVFGRSERIM